MENYYNRTIQIANYIVENNATIRKAAKVFSMAKSTVHYDLSNRLKTMDRLLYVKVKKILKINFNEKHLRGGEATKKMYEKKNKKNKAN